MKGRYFEEGWYYFTEHDGFGFGPGIYNLKLKYPDAVYKFGKEGAVSWSYVGHYLNLLKTGKIQKLTNDELIIKDIIE